MITLSRSSWLQVLLVAGIMSLLAVGARHRAECVEREVEEREGDREPRLLLPGALVATPGRTIELAWADCDSVREMEVLLSVDGGRHYERAVTPSLDPRVRRWRWRVPDMQGRPVRLRIRYNRGGREIEGPPTAVLATSPGAARDVEPLALPVRSAGGESAPEGRVPTAAGLTACDEPLADSVPPRIAATGPADVVHPVVVRNVAPERAHLGASLENTPRIFPLRT